MTSATITTAMMINATLAPVFSPWHGFAGSGQAVTAIRNAAITMSGYPERACAMDEIRRSCADATAAAPRERCFPRRAGLGARRAVGLTEPADERRPNRGS